MIELETIYDSRVENTLLLQHRYIMVVVARATEELVCRCCGGTILFDCCFLWITVRGARPGEYNTSIPHCRDCSEEGWRYQHYGTVNWKEYVCKGECTPLHTTWSATRRPYVDTRSP